MGIFSKGSGEALTWHTEQRRIGDLVEWDRNPRQMTEKQAEDLATSLKRFGYVEEIVLNADGKSIIGGHMRRKVIMAQALMDPDAMVDVRLPSRALSEKESEELAIRLNRNTGEWDFDLLSGMEIPDLISWGFDEKTLGVGPDFAPVSADEQGKLDGLADKEAVKCPECGHEFTP